MLILVSLPNVDQFLEPTFTLVPIGLEIESPYLDSHILLMGEECEFQFFDLDSTLEPKPTLEPKVDFPELVMVSEPITLEFKSIIPPSHILLLDIGIDLKDSVMIFQDWSCKENKFFNRIFHVPIHIRECNYVHRKEVNKRGFHELLHYLYWVATLGLI